MLNELVLLHTWVKVKATHLKTIENIYISEK